MSTGGKRAYLTRALSSHVQSIQETFQMLDKSADSSLDKVDWSQITKFGDEISKQATVAGMLWSGEAPDAKELEENLGAYFNVLHGFILLCHGSTVGAGPTLHASIRASAKQVIDCSLSLLTEAVSSSESRDSGKRLSIPTLSGAVWEACAALKKTPATNCTAIGRAITQVAVSIKDVLREMRELKPVDGTHGEAADLARGSGEEDSSSDGDLGDDLSPEEMNIAQLVIGVVSDTLPVVKEVIRFITGLLKSSGRECGTESYTDSLERLLSYCQEMGTQVNELGACVYPPQEIAQMKSIVTKMYRAIDEIRAQVGGIGGSAEGLFRAFEGLEDSLGRMDSGLNGDPVPEMGHLAV